MRTREIPRLHVCHGMEILWWVVVVVIRDNESTVTNIS